LRFRPELNWPYAIFLIVVSFLGCGFIAFIVTFGPVSGDSPASVLLTRIAIDAACVCAVAALLIKLRNDSQVELDDDGITRPTLIGMRTLRWSEVREVRFDWPALHLVGDDTRIAIYPWVYREPHVLFSEVGKHVRHLLSKQPETQEPPLSPEETSQRPLLLRLLIGLVRHPGNLAGWGHLAAVWFYALVIASYLPRPGRRVFGAFAFAFATLYISQQLWKRTTPRTAMLADVTWAAILATAVLTAPTTWSTRTDSVIYFSVSVVVLFALHFLTACGLLVIRASLKPRRSS
jgi:hypothetical protein